MADLAKIPFATRDPCREPARRLVKAAPERLPGRPAQRPKVAMLGSIGVGFLVNQRDALDIAALRLAGGEPAAIGLRGALVAPQQSCDGFSGDATGAHEPIHAAHRMIL